MEVSDQAVELNGKMLSVYLRCAAAGAVLDAAEVVREVSAIASQFPSSAGVHAAMFDRYVALIALYLSEAARLDLTAALASIRHPSGQTRLGALPPAFEGHVAVLGPLRTEGRPGISVVTCCMNRNENLIKALPSWLVNAEISEVLIVDWSSKVPVADDLQRAGITDPRIRILRVDNEPRWVLTYAFNAGFRAAACDTILKLDADIVLSDGFFRQNQIADGTFIAGNWRTATDDQAHINGFFFVSRQALHDVAGFNEHIISYGWDDEDIYERLTLAGYRRKDVAPDTIFHLEHSDEQRTGGSAVVDGPPTLRSELVANTQYLIRLNRYVACVMPTWQRSSILLPMRVVSRTDTVMTVSREGWVPSRVPAQILASAANHALSELVFYRLGRRALELRCDVLARVLDRPAVAVSRVDIEVAISAPDQIIQGPGHYMVLSMPGGWLDAKSRWSELPRAVDLLITHGNALGLTPVIWAPHVHYPAQTPPALAALPLIPSWESIGEMPRFSATGFMANAAPPTSTVRIDLDRPGVETVAAAAPYVAVNRRRLFLDGQHGLGNRLRALGSAAAIADAVDMELVVVWEPDDHCNCRFSDLFDYKGAVIEERFLTRADAQGCDVYNYMPTEPGADKDALIRLDRDCDIYARSAFVLNSPFTSWVAENRFLQSLPPVEPIRQLVAGVRHPNDLSAHIRMEGGKSVEHLPYENPANWLEEDHDLIDLWRSRSHFSHFLRRIDTLIAEGRANRIFLAADMPETYAEFQHHYGDRLAWLPRSLYDRSAEQLHYAYADAMLLSKSPLLLGSTWSSFSELATRLAPQEIAIEMSGKDF
jgi:hypothetical protein